MKAAIIAIVLGSALGIVKLCIRTKLFDGWAYNKTFACPNCGARFNVKWYQMIYKFYTVSMYNAAHLKCPICHKKDMCSFVYEEI